MARCTISRPGLRTHPAVGEGAVVAVSDHGGAHRLRAFVVPVTPVPVGLEADLICLARENVAAIMVPRGVSFVPSLLRTAAGRLRRHPVRRGAW
ncbi:AMP-binding enzyme [Streptomyces sp. NPDC003480]